MTISCLIIDDDSFIQDLLRDKIEHHFPELKVLGVANSGEKGIELIQKHSPELVFLDVEMSDMTGFEMLSKLETINFQTIFITSYNHYAIKAIRFNALDYLLKPFDLGELQNAVKRYKKFRNNGKHSIQHMSHALNNFKYNNVSNQVLTLKTQQGVLSLPLKEIICIKGDRNYSMIVMSKGKTETISKTLGDLEELLDEKGFFRCHKSFLVNKEHITRHNSKVLLSNEAVIPVSRRKKVLFDEWMESQKAL
ncbi:LytR/AlgR family response regulator transcription factor [Geojedonia litorea]|uniref:LytR/AlgR family response regulator transcription factor n=1 Tax=Geojedonia litorea TaxID=1268269 RepID=A0ABV9N4L0_9FLAO